MNRIQEKLFQAAFGTNPFFSLYNSHESARDG